MPRCLLQKNPLTPLNPKDASVRKGWKEQVDQEMGPADIRGFIPYPRALLVSPWSVVPGQGLRVQRVGAVRKNKPPSW